MFTARMGRLCVLPDRQWNTPWSRRPIARRQSIPAHRRSLQCAKRTGALFGRAICPEMTSSGPNGRLPSLSKPADRRRIVFPGGDGCLYAFEPITGKLVWKLDCNTAQPDFTKLAHRDLGFEFTRPSFAGGAICIGLHQGLAGGQSHGSAMFCLELPSADSRAPRVRWARAGRNESSMASPTIVGGSAYVLTDDGLLLKRDMASGRTTWRADVGITAEFGSPVLHCDRLYVPTVEGVYVFAIGQSPKCVGFYDIESGDPVVGTPLVRGDRMYVTTRHYLWAIELNRTREKRSK